MLAASVLLPAALVAQPDIKLGAETYAQNCANQYCHGADGEPGAAPALAGRGMRYRGIARPVIYSVRNTNMPPWKDNLSQLEFDAVIEYVLSLQGPAKISVATTHSQQVRPFLKHPGRELFFDAGRVGACGSCHEFEGLGIAIAPPIREAPASVAALRAAAGTAVRTVTTGSGASFPALEAEGDRGLKRYYDLSPKLPVLRALAPDQVAAEAGSDWTHEARLALYGEAEQSTLVEYLQQALGR